MLNYVDKTCSLECKHGGAIKEPLHEFVGPVKIIFVDPTFKDHFYKEWGPGLITCAYFLIVASFVTVLCYTLTFKEPMSLNVHIAACTIGFNLLMPSAVVILEPMFAGGMHLVPVKRIHQHVILQSFSIVYVLVGVGHLYLSTHILSSWHGITGLSAAGSMIIVMLYGTCIYAGATKNQEKPDHEKNVSFHKLLGLLTLGLAVGTFCTGVLRPSFRNWCYYSRLDELPLVLLAFSIIYTLFIMLFVIWRILSP